MNRTELVISVVVVLLLSLLLYSRVGYNWSVVVVTLPTETVSIPTSTVQPTPARKIPVTATWMPTATKLPTRAATATLEATKVVVFLPRVAVEATSTPGVATELPQAGGWTIGAVIWVGFIVILAGMIIWLAESKPKR